jgi:hypothetical protein
VTQKRRNPNHSYRDANLWDFSPVKHSRYYNDYYPYFKGSFSLFIPFKNITGRLRQGPINIDKHITDQTICHNNGCLRQLKLIQDTGRHKFKIPES